MDNTSITAYRNEYETEGIGVTLYRMITSIVRQVVRRYPPVIYAPLGVWDEDAISALTHDFTMDRLLGRGRLEYYLLSLQNVEQLQRCLHIDFRHFLIDHKRDTETTNLFQRVRHILHTSPEFTLAENLSNRRNQVWGRADWIGKSQVERLVDVVVAMYGVPLPPIVRYRAQSVKLSHLIATVDLMRLLEETLLTLDRWVSLDLLFDGLRYRLGLFEGASLSLDEPFLSEDGVSYLSNILGSTNDPGSLLQVKEAAQDIFDRLSDRQRLVLAFRLNHPDITLEAISQQLKVPRSTIHHDLQTLATYAQNVDLPVEDGPALLDVFVAMCQPYLDNLLIIQLNSTERPNTVHEGKEDG